MIITQIQFVILRSTKLVTWMIHTTHTETERTYREDTTTVQSFIQVCDDMISTNQDPSAKSKAPSLAESKDFGPRWPGYDISHPSIDMGSRFKQFLRRCSQ